MLFKYKADLALSLSLSLSDVLLSFMLKLVQPGCHGAETLTSVSGE